jgi:beta-phosphoglucomutase
MTTPAPRAVLWDMDGTLVDTGDLHLVAWHETLAPLGRAYGPAEHEACFGMRNDAILRRLLDPAIDDASIARIAGEKEHRFRALAAARGLTPLPGVLSFLRALRAAGFRQAIASSAPPDNVTAIVAAAGFEGLFDAMASGEHVPNGKPAPDLFLHAARLVDVSPARCIVVEDAAVGVLAGRRAGMKTVGVGPNHEKLDADVKVERLDKLPEDAFQRLVPL